jgi:hypothetical protein
MNTTTSPAFKDNADSRIYFNRLERLGTFWALTDIQLS